MTKALCLFTAVGLLVSYAREPGSTSNARPVTDRAIYEVLLDALRPDSHSVVLRRTFLDVSGPGQQRSDLAAWVSKQRGGIDSALVVDPLTARYPGAVSDFVQPADGLGWDDSSRTSDPPRTQSSDATVHRTQAGILTDSFSKTPEPISGPRLLAFSRIVYTRDSSRALVYASMWCGKLCGNESFYLLGRGAKGSWRVIATVVRIIS